MINFNLNTKPSDYVIWETYYTYGSRYNIDKANCLLKDNSRCNQRYTLNLPRTLVTSLTDYILTEFEYPKEFDNLDLSYLIKITNIYGEALVLFDNEEFHIYTPNSFRHLENGDILISLETGDYVLRDNKMYTKNSNDTLTYQRDIKFQTLHFFNDNRYPNGKSLYSDCLDLFDAVDLKYSYLTEEFILGKPMVIIDPSATRVEEFKTQSNMNAGEYRQVYDDKANIFKVLPRQDITNPDKYMPVEQIEFNLRVNEFTTAIDFDLGLISQACNFDSDFLKISNTGTIQRQTQVLSSKSTLYNMIRNCQQSIIKFMLNFGIKQYKIEDFSIGDSIITDDTAKQLQGNTLFSIKAIDNLTLLVDFYNYTEEQALAIIERVKQERIDLNDLELSLLSTGEDKIGFEDTLVPPIINEPNINQTTLPTQIPQI